MTDLHWGTEEVSWVAQVRLDLLALARACLGDSPVIPMEVSQKAVPISNRASELLDLARSSGMTEANWASDPKLRWTENVRALFKELAEMYLSDRPKLPENVSERALDLSDAAQKLFIDSNDAGVRPVATPVAEPVAAPVTEPTSPLGSADTAPTVTRPDIPAQMDALHRALKQAWGENPDANVREWQQLLTLLEVMQDIHQRMD